ncbi:MAG: glycine cleavage system protein GcvH [Sphingobacteriales bacterium]|nr:MAG: glycine cleavage system protein GcvH [Sphingobacteriales bacterium]
MNTPENLVYSKEHVWLRMEGDIATIGITEFAQSELGEIVFVDLPPVGKKFKKGHVFGSVEAVKTTSDLFMPVGGEIIEVNSSLENQADLVNTKSSSDGWMMKILLSDISEVNYLLSEDDYQKLVS